VLAGTAKRELAQTERRRAELYALAALITRGHHAPQKFPKPADFLGRDKPARPAGSEAAFAAYMRARIAGRQTNP